MLFPNKQNPASPEYKQFRVLKILSVITLILTIVGFLFGLYFIYKNIFQTLSNSESILMQKIGDNIEIIDFEKLDKVMKNFNEKITAPTAREVNDPFFGKSVSSTTSTPN